MSSLKRITKNSAYNLLTSVVSKIITMVITIMLARYLGVEHYGKWAFVFGFAGLFAVFGDFGLGILIKRTVSREKDAVNTHFSSAVIISSIMNLLTIGIILVAGWLLKYDATTYKLIMLGALFIVFQNFKIPFKKIYEAYEKMQLVFVSRTIKMVVRLVAVIILIQMRMPLVHILLLYVLIEFITIGLDFILYNSYITKLKFRRHNVKPLFKQMIPFGVAGLFMTVYDKIDITLLSKLLVDNTDIFIGWYSSAYELMSALLFIPLSISSAIAPVAYQASRKKLEKIYEVTFSLFLNLSFAICVGTVLLADKIILLIYGSEFTGSIIALQILIWAIIFNFAMVVNGIVLNSINLEKETMKATIISVIFNIVANIIFIPIYGYLAAAYTTLGSVFIYNVYCYYIVEKEFIRLPYIKLLWKGIFSSILMGAAIYFLNLNLLFSIIIGMVVFFGLMFLLKGFDLQIIRKIITFMKR